MLFNSIEFIFFFLFVTIFYFVLPYRFRWILLLGASCYFYMVFVPVYILILGFTIVIDYIAGLVIESSTKRARVWWLRVSLVANIGILAIFKYYNFLNDNLSTLLKQAHISQIELPYLSILLPIGLSFHTFQAMSYTIEVYRGHQKAERHFGIYALYVMFYPQLVAGPIERPQNILHQFYEKHDFDYQRVVNGLKQIAWGFFKKLVIADRISPVVDHVYDHPQQFGAVPLICATILFAVQIYCDFSGYSDIALGTARIMGFDLMRNFKSPYFSKSVSEFWTRWHISLSTWFRDYLYIPLGGNRVTRWRWYTNLMITFLISGLWHGASWTYVAWGGLNGLYIVIDSILNKNKKPVTDHPIIAAFKVAFTFILICSTWVFFRANNLYDAQTVFSHILTNQVAQVNDINFIRSVLSNLDILVTLFSVSLLVVVDYTATIINIPSLLSQRSFSVRMAVYYFFIMIILLFGKFQVNEQFIYFQF